MYFWYFNKLFIYISGMDCVGKANASKKLVQGKQLKC